MNYLLMNRDMPWLLFTLERNVFEEVECHELSWFSGKHPYGYDSLADYLHRRQAPKHRKHIPELFSQYGCDNLEGFLNITHALSLNDTFWVKPEDSGLCWADVSLYRSPFDELVSAAAFDGRPGGTSLSSTSPEFGTDGYFAKCWVREGQDIFLYKCGSDTFEVEPLSEFLATQVAERVCPEVVRYDLGFYHDRLVSKCRLFTSEQLGLVKAHDMLPQRERSISRILRRFEELGFGDEFRRMCVLDALILNVDRHLGNFGVLVDNQTLQIQRMAPVFDHNRSLLFDMDQAQLENLPWCIGTCKPRIGTDFVATARGMLTPEICRDVEELREFSFRQHSEIRADQVRLDALSAVVRSQAERILE